MIALVVGALVGVADQARADAIVITQAMKATTIVEVFIASDSVRVELEIGVADLDAFRNIMPDEIYQRLGFETEPFVTRARRFFREDFVIAETGGRRLPGRIVAIEPRQRIKRDVITGEPLPADDTQAEVVVFVALEYAFTGKPQSLTLKPPQIPEDRFAAADIGFVVYHLGLPVTDFRYLGSEEILDLDWEDPWFSRFRNRNLKRQYDAPLSVFLYVDHFEVRKEIVVRPKDLQQWIDLGLAGRDTIFAAEQSALKDTIAAFLAERGTVTIDGRAAVPQLDRIHFIRRTLRTTGVIDPPVDLPAISATLGVIFVYPVDQLPQKVDLAWELFGPRIQQVPSVATDEAGGLPYLLTPDDPVLTWQNFLTNPTTPKLATIAPPPTMGTTRVPWLSLLAAGAAIAMGWRWVHRTGSRSRRAVAAAVSLFALAILTWPTVRLAVPNPFSRTTALEAVDTETVVGGLLTNIYRAFDFRDEDSIYDTLARSAAGDLLNRVYLETRKSLELQNQGGARIKVKDVTVLEATAENLRHTTGFRARCRWNVAGSVGHWGHIHTRTNQYDALLTIEPVAGIWKITDLELLQEDRLS
jgi:hypothetical protein